MSGKTLAMVGTGFVVAIVAVGGFALFHDDSDTGRTTNHKPGTTGTTNTGQGTTPQAPVPLPPPHLTPPSPSQTSPTAPPTGPSNVGRNGRPTSQPQGPPRGIPVIPGGVKAAPIKPGKGGGPVIVVHGPDNQPVVGAIVQASTQRGALPPRPTNKDGEAALDSIPAGSGTVKGTVRHPKFAEPATFTCEANASRVDVRFSGGTTTGFLVGMIHDARGQGPPAVELTVIDSAGTETVLPSTAFVSYDGSGRFKVELAAGGYSIKAAAPGYVASDLAYPNVAAGAETTVDLLLEAGGTITGKVTLPPELQVQRDPVVLTFDLQWVRGDEQNPTTITDHRQIQLDADGGYVLDNLQSGTYRVRCGDGQRLTGWAGAKIDAGSNVTLTALNFSSAPPMAPVRGLVRDSRGGVVAGATVRTRMVTVLTDAGGGFELRGLDPGRQEITVEKVGYSTFTGMIEAPLAGSPAPPDTVVTLDQRSSATGKVMKGGAPAANVKVLVVQKLDGGMTLPHQTFTDGAGNWTVGDLEVGNYFLKVGDKASPFDDAGALAVFEVRAGEAAQVKTVEAP